REIPEGLWQLLGEGFDDDGGGVDHQCLVGLGRRFDQMGDGFGAATGRDVLVRGGGDEAGFGQRLAGAAGRVVPTTAGTAGDQKVDVIYFGLYAEAGAKQAAEQGALEGSLQHDVLLVIVAKRLINHVGLENNLTVM